MNWIENSIPSGYLALTKKLNIKAISHYRESYLLIKGGQNYFKENEREIYLYPKRYMHGDSFFHHLEFALKYDGINLEILTAIFKKIDTKKLSDYISEHPTSKIRRRIWFLYEFLMDKSLNLPDAKQTSYIKLLDENIYYTGISIPSKRHYIYNNLLGNRDFCPILRKTSKLKKYNEIDFQNQISKIINNHDPKTVTRATNYLYAKETRSSYEIEKVRPDKIREAKFISILKKAGTINLSKETFINLQNHIVDERFADKNYRNFQNYIGERIHINYEHVHYISPQPQDVNTLMNGLEYTHNKMLESKLHPILIASVIAYGFVFIHPFTDGNGRIHRFLIHHILDKSNFTPPGGIFPVSSVMLNNIQEYNESLEQFSKPLQEIIEPFSFDKKGNLLIEKNDKHYYQYLDYTMIAEYLFRCVQKTIDNDFIKELNYIESYDKSKTEIKEYLDMPDKMIDLIINFILQNKGKLSDKKRDKFFSMLKKEEIKKIESTINNNFR